MPKTELIISHSTPNKTLSPPVLFPQSHPIFYNSSLTFHSLYSGTIHHQVLQVLPPECLRFTSSIPLPLFNSDFIIDCLIYCNNLLAPTFYFL